MIDKEVFLGRRIRERRKELGLSQEAVAFELNIDQSEFSKIERGKYLNVYPHLGSLEKILQLEEESLRKIYVEHRGRANKTTK